MVLNTLRMLAAALDDPVIGVNAKLNRIPLDGTDSRPPDVLRIAEPTVDEGILRGDYGLTFPMLVVSPEEPIIASGEVNQTRRDAEPGSYTILYASNDPDVAVAMRDGLYTCRAIAACIADLMQVGNIDRRTRNGIVIQYCTQIIYGSSIESIKEGLITAVVNVAFQVRDTNPMP